MTAAPDPYVREKPKKGPRGYVTLYWPLHAGGYFRAKWNVVVDGYRHEGDTTVGRDLAAAAEKVRAIEADIAAGSTDKTKLPVDAAIDYWLDPSTPRPRKHAWSESQAGHMRRFATHYLRPALRDLQCQHLRRRHLQTVVNMGFNADQGKRLREACVSLLTAMRNGDFLLDTQVIDMSGVYWHNPNPPAGDQLPDDAGYDDDEDAAGFVIQFVPASKRPTHDAVRALREAADARARMVWWRGLMVELAAYSGLRQCELLALRPCDVDLERRRIRVIRQVRRKGGFSRPKGRKFRTTIFPTISPTGYALLKALARRCAEVDPTGLLFGTASGKAMSPSNFHRDVFEKAAIAAGWTWRWVTQMTVNGPKRVRRFDLSWHSLRHVFCSTALDEWGVSITRVSLLAGHANRYVTERLYISASADELDEVGLLVP